MRSRSDHIGNLSPVIRDNFALRVKASFTVEYTVPISLDPVTEAVGIERIVSRFLVSLLIDYVRDRCE
jgi:hypothetical protein